MKIDKFKKKQYFDKNYQNDPDPKFIHTLVIYVFNQGYHDFCLTINGFS